MTMFQTVLSFYRNTKTYGVTKINIKIRIKCRHYGVNSGVNIGGCVSDIIVLNILFG